MRHAASYQDCSPADDIEPAAIAAARELIPTDKVEQIEREVADYDSGEAALELIDGHLSAAFAALFDGKTLLDLTPDQIQAFRALERKRAALAERLDEKLDEAAADLVRSGALRWAA